MAVVEFRVLFIHDARDLSDFVAIDAYDVHETPEVSGEIRKYGSRSRIVTTEETSREVAYEVTRIPTATLEWLLARRGLLLMFRDTYGRLVWGTTFAVPYRNLKDRTDLVDASWSVREATHTVEV